MENLMIIGAAIATLFVVITFLAILYRVVVPTNDVHIVQSAERTVAYGTGEAAGNVYYKWPAWAPFIGVRVSVLQVSVFDIQLQNFAAYDKDRLPFSLDMMAFFRVSDPAVAARRVHTPAEMTEQLHGILQGAARTILASHEMGEILEGRSKFGEAFTKEVDHQLEQWGVQTVKNIEFMDIRDATGSQVIHNIMAKKKSVIEMESRVEVAVNMQKAQMAEIDAQRQVKTQEQDALQQIGVRTAQKDQAIGIENERAKQEVLEQARATTEKTMAVKKVEQVRAAEIAKDVQVVQAQQAKETDVIKADGQKQQTVLIAEGNLQSKQLEAKGIEAEGLAKAEAEKALQLAPVTAQITLAKEIGSNEGYQKYLLGAKQIDANQVVGVAQAEALVEADVKIIANAGNPVEGAKSVMELLTPKGGMQLGAMAEAFMGTEAGQALAGKLLDGKKSNGSARA